MFRNKLTKILAGTMVAMVAITATVPVLAAEDNPNKSNYEINIVDCSRDNNVKHCLASSSAYADVENEKGLSYNKKTNTLTLSNYNAINKGLDIENLGDNFTLKVKGKNKLRYIKVHGEWGGNLTITGNGTLSINTERKSPYAIDCSREMNSTETLTVTVENGVTLKAYSGSEKKEGASVNCSRAGKVVYNFVSSNQVVAGKSEIKMIALFGSDEESELELQTAIDTLEGTYAIDDDGAVYRLTELEDGTFIAVIYRGTDEDNSDFNGTGEKISARVCHEAEVSVAKKSGEKYAVDKTDVITVYELISVEGTKIPYANKVDSYITAKAFGSSGYKIVKTDKTVEAQVNGDVKIAPIAKTSVTVTPGKMAIRAIAKEIAGANKYQLQYSTNKSMKDAKLLDLKKNTITTKGFESGKKYYIQVRVGEKTISGKTMYGGWSEAVAVKIK